MLAALLVATLNAALPATPTNHIQDDARILAADELSTLTVQLSAFTAKTGIEFHLDTNTFLGAGVDPGTRTRQLLRGWSADRSAIILAVERSHPGSPTIQLSHGLWDRFSEPELIALLDHSAEVFRAQSGVKEAIIASTNFITEQLSLIQVKTEGSDSAHKPVVRTRLLIAIGVVMVCLWLCAMFRRSNSTCQSLATPEFFHCPKLPQRLGGTDGGGVLVARNVDLMPLVRR